MEKLTLHQLTQEEMKLAAALEDGGGELTPELEQVMNELGVQRVQKIDAYHHVLLRLDGAIRDGKDEKNRIQARVKTLENCKTRLKDNLKDFMLALGINRMDGTNCIAYMRNNPESVECDEDAILKPFDKLVENFQKRLPDYVRVEIKLDRTALKSAVFSGTPVNAHLVQTQSVIIK